MVDWILVGFQVLGICIWIIYPASPVSSISRFAQFPYVNRIYIYIFLAAVKHTYVRIPRIKFAGSVGPPDQISAHVSVKIKYAQWTMEIYQSDNQLKLGKQSSSIFKNRVGMKLCSLVCSPSPKSFHKTYEAFACGGLPFSGRSFYVGRRRYVIFRIHFICKKIYEKASQCEYALKLFPMHTILCMCRYNSFMNVKGIPTPVKSK